MRAKKLANQDPTTRLYASDTCYSTRRHVPGLIKDRVHSQVMMAVYHSVVWVDIKT